MLVCNNCPPELLQHGRVSKQSANRIFANRIFAVVFLDSFRKLPFEYTLIESKVDYIGSILKISTT